MRRALHLPDALCCFPRPVALAAVGTFRYAGVASLVLWSAPLVFRDRSGQPLTGEVFCCERTAQSAPP